MMTPGEVCKLSDDELRVRVAKIDVWEYIEFDNGVGRWLGNPPGGDYTDSDMAYVADYPNDLNAAWPVARAFAQKHRVLLDMSVRGDDEDGAAVFLGASVYTDPIRTGGTAKCEARLLCEALVIADARVKGA